MVDLEVWDWADLCTECFHKRRNHGTFSASESTEDSLSIHFADNRLIFFVIDRCHICSCPKFNSNIEVNLDSYMQL